MSRHHFYSYIQDSGGNRVQTASIYIYKAGTDTGATVYDAETAGSASGTPPQCVTDTTGLFNFWIDDDIYSRHQEFKLIARKDGLTTASIDNVIINWTPDGWIKKTSSYTAKVGDKILFDSSATHFTITLPADPSFSDTVRCRDCAGTAVSKPVTIGRNSQNIRAVGADLVLDVNWCDVELNFVNATIGWRYSNG